MKNNNLFTETSLTRPGLVDMWNAFMVKNAIFEGDYDMPLCPCTAKSPPKELISYEDAKSLYKKEIKNGNTNFFVDAMAISVGMICCTTRSTSHGIRILWKVRHRLSIRPRRRYSWIPVRSISSTRRGRRGRISSATTMRPILRRSILTLPGR